MTDLGDPTIGQECQYHQTQKFVITYTTRLALNSIREENDKYGVNTEAKQ